MFDFIKRNLGMISVREDDDIIYVSGVDGKLIYADFRRYWKTDKVPTNIFLRVGSNSISFYSFFAPDILYAINIIIATNKRQYLSIRSLSFIRDGIVQNTRFKTIVETPASRLDYLKLSNMKLTPLIFQSEFFKVYDENTQRYQLNGFLLAATAGSGKTNTALTLVELLGKKKVLIVCPMNAVYQVWVKHIENKSFKDKQTFSTSKDSINFNDRFIICHYESLELIMRNINKFDPNETAIILDESHNFNEITANRTQLFINICNSIKTKDVLLLSGTPIKAVPAEAIPLFRSIDNTFTEEVETAFKKIYRANNNRGTDILANRLGLVSFKVQKEELGLSKPIFEKIKIQMDNSHEYTLSAIKIKMQEFVATRRMYYKDRYETDKKLFDDGIDIYEKTINFLDNRSKVELRNYLDKVQTLIQTQGKFVDSSIFQECNRFEIDNVYPAILKKDSKLANEWKAIRSTIKYVSLKIQGECLGTIVGGNRIKCHVDMAKHVNFKGICDTTTKKTVVFSSFVEVVEQCMIQLENQGLIGAFVYAKTNSKLPQIISSFQKDERVNPLVATYKSLSTAVPLTMADVMILIDSPYRDYILQQAVSRIHRLDSDTQTYIYTLELDTGSEYNISQRSTEILQWSQSQIKSIIGIESPFEITDLDGSTEFSASLESFFIEKPKYLSWN